ncbi:MAG: hypothetical protein DLM57_06270 [Pseudonocardiales bacterium]|nr:MAG: hypothetical protein DLM57_06270 [Pseudonocardiales bacterium]
MTLTWSASTGTPAPIGYYLVRTDSSNVAAAACATSPGTTTSALTCTESGIAAGTYAYTVTAVSRSWTATSVPASVTVAVQTPTELVFTTQPSNSTGGVAFPSQPVVAIKDGAGNVITTNVSAVSLAIQTPAGATLSCTANPRSALAGVATFSGCAINKPGSYILVATDGPLTVASASITIGIGPAARLTFSVSPSDSFVNGKFFSQPIVTIQDAGGNTISSDTSSVTLAITTPAGALLGCTANPRIAAAGVATFAGCLINKSGAYTLTASDGSLTPAVSASFTVSAAPTNLAWSGNTTTVCTTPASGTAFALIYNGCSLVLGISAGTFASKLMLADASGSPVTNLGVDLTVTLAPVTGSVSPTTVTIAHGQSVSSVSSTFHPGYGALGPYTDTVTASAPAVISATAKLNA